MSQTEHIRPRGVLGANGLCMAAMLTWAVGFPASDILLQTWDPLSLITARLAMVLAILLPLWALWDGGQAVLNANWGWGTVVGALGFGTGTFLLLYGQSISDPVTVAIVASTMPVAAAFLEVIFDNRRLRWPLVLGITLVVVGGVIASGVSTSGWNFGAVCALLSVVAFAWASRAAVKDFPELSAIGQSALTFAGAFVFCASAYVIVSLAGFAELSSPKLDAFGWSMLAIYAVAAMALSQVLWIMGIGRLGIAVASLHTNSASFYVMLFMVALGAAWNWTQAFGAVIVAAGVMIAQMRGR